MTKALFAALALCAAAGVVGCGDGYYDGYYEAGYYYDPYGPYYDPYYGPYWDPYCGCYVKPEPDAWDAAATSSS